MKVKDFYIKPTSEEMHKAIQQFLFCHDIGWCYSGKKIESYETNAIVVVDGEMQNGLPAITPDPPEITIDELFKLFDEPKESEIELSGDYGNYTVKFNDDNTVTAGCVTVDFKTVRKIYKRMKKNQPRGLKVGDKVRLIKGGKIGDETKEWCKYAGLEFGKVYTICSILSSGYVYLSEAKSYSVHPGHFKLVK